MRRLFSFVTAGAFALSATATFAEDVTLRVWDTFADQTEGMAAFIADFEAANPGIKIQRDVQSNDQMRPIIQTALSSGTGPDVLYYDTGPGFAGVLAKAGLLLPLDDAYDAGMFSAVYPWTKERTTFDGKTYGVGNEVEFLGVYYNQAMFDELGLKAPTTYEEFLAVAKALKDADKIPVAFGDADGWPAFHLFSLYTNNIIGKAGIEAMIAGKTSWDTPEVAEAIKLFFVDMNSEGLLPPSVNAITYDDTTNLFLSGQAGMNITGTWQIGSFSASDFPVGWFFLPKPGGGDPLPPAGLGSGYFISSATQHPEEAKKFLAYLFDPANAAHWVEGLQIVPPYKVDTTNLKVSPLLSFAMDALAKVPMGYNIDVLMPDAFNTAMLNGFQAVLAGDRTPAEQAAALQATVGK